MKKNLFAILAISLLLIGCKNDTESTNSEVTVEPIEERSLKGAWKMASYLNYSGDGSVDTIKTSEKFMQMKMFSETKYMWNRFSSYDSSEWFGSGDYTFKSDTLIEHTKFGSKDLLTILEKDSIHRLSIIFINKESYMQIEKIV